MKTTSLCIFSLIPLLASAAATPNLAVHHFERRYIDDLAPSYQHHNETIKLIGYKKVVIPNHARNDFEESYYSFVDTVPEYKTTFYDQSTGILKLYFPVQSALVEHDGELLEANHLGEFEIEELRGDYTVRGRKKTAQVHGVHGNIIKDGIIYLETAAVPVSRHGKVFVYDFGWKSLTHGHDHDHHGSQKRSEEGNGDSSEEQKNRGCVTNHGGINCSKAYGINQGRCKMNAKTCMDYNGYAAVTSFLCKKSLKYVNFVGSDCFVSVARGNCWNELEAAERP